MNDPIVALLRQQLATRDRDVRNLLQELRDNAQRHEQQVAQLHQQYQQQIAQLHQQYQQQIVENARQAREDAREDARDNLNFMRHQLDGNDQFMRNLGNGNARFMREMAASVLGRIVRTDQSTTERVVQISENLNENHRVNGTREIREPLQPHIMIMEKREGDKVVGKIRRGQLRHINREQAKLVEDGFRMVQKTPVGNAISTAQHLTAEARRNLPLGVSDVSYSVSSSELTYLTCRNGNVERRTH